MISYFYGIGVLLKQKLIDIVLVDELLVNIIFLSWARMGPILKGFKENVAGSRCTARDEEEVLLVTIPRKSARSRNKRLSL